MLDWVTIPYKQCAPPALLSVNRDVAQQTFRICVLSDNSSQSAVYLNINKDFDYLHMIHGRHDHIYEARVKDTTPFKGPGGQFRYSQKTMDIRMVARFLTPAITRLSCPVPMGVWYDFISSSLKKKWTTTTQIGRKEAESNKWVWMKGTERYAIGLLISLLYLEPLHCIDMVNAEAGRDLTYLSSHTMRNSH